MMKIKPFIAVFAILLLFVPGCGAHRMDVLADIEANPYSGAYINGVPFFMQNTSLCGPAALASVFNYWDVGESVEDIAERVYQEKLNGSLPIDLLLYAKEKGFQTTFYKGGMDDLRVKTAHKIPLILFLNLGSMLYPIGHFVVVVGYNDNYSVVLAHSAMEDEKVYSYEELDKLWSKTGYSTLLIRPKVIE